ncbi:5522_t:CDS:2 [Entrophospora sp. SA101]|nr:5522_t:CDS:2 [Entrophospora sp. SA101]
MKTLEATDYGFLTYEPNNTTTIRMSTSVLPAPTKPGRQQIQQKNKKKIVPQLSSESKNILLRGRLINLSTTDLNIDFVAEENETSEEEDIDNIMNRPRKVFKPTKKSDKKIIPTNQILVNKSNEEPLAVLMDENINPNHYVRGGNNNNFNFNNFNPHSRPTSPNQFRPLSYLSHGHLSAREQELLARETGSPLINLPEKPKGPQTGLIGAIAAIEVRRRSQGQGVLARQAEAEREREREHRLMEQRQQLLIAERDHSLYNRPGGPGNGGGGSDFRSRFISNQPHYDLAPINSQRNFYNEGDFLVIKKFDDMIMSK